MLNNYNNKNCSWNAQSYGILPSMKSEYRANSAETTCCFYWIFTTTNDSIYFDSCRRLKFAPCVFVLSFSLLPSLCGHARWLRNSNANNKNMGKCYETTVQLTNVSLSFALFCFWFVFSIFAYLFLLSVLLQVNFIYFMRLFVTHFVVILCERTRTQTRARANYAIIMCHFRLYCLICIYAYP